MSSGAHVPVLLGPVLDGLAIRQGGIYVDATFGRGGHSRAILERLSAAGRLIAIDRDPQALAAAAPELTSDPRLELVRSEFGQLAKRMEERRLMGRVDGLLFDLGVSSPQLDEAQRGFSFLRDGPLDMRMDPASGISAATWLQSVEEVDLRRVLRKFGEERDAAIERLIRRSVLRRIRAPRSAICGAMIIALSHSWKPQHIKLGRHWVNDLTTGGKRFRIYSYIFSSHCKDLQWKSIFRN